MATHREDPNVHTDRQGRRVADFPTPLAVRGYGLQWREWFARHDVNLQEIPVPCTVVVDDEARTITVAKIIADAHGVRIGDTRRTYSYDLPIEPFPNTERTDQ